ncbi:MAG: hypothetical protein KKB02_00325 [Alphaproteobacteria bacterium]|nr:hypothetical protein [Alphaproteobacteria bacterium]
MDREHVVLTGHGEHGALYQPSRAVDLWRAKDTSAAIVLCLEMIDRYAAMLTIRLKLTGDAALHATPPDRPAGVQPEHPTPDATEDLYTDNRFDLEWTRLSAITGQNSFEPFLDKTLAKVADGDGNQTRDSLHLFG